MKTRPVDECGQQTAALEYDGLSRDEIFHYVERFDKACYLRPRAIGRMLAEMLLDFDVLKRLRREGEEFFRCLHLRSAAKALALRCPPPPGEWRI